MAQREQRTTTLHQKRGMPFVYDIKTPFGAMRVGLSHYSEKNHHFDLDHASRLVLEMPPSRGAAASRRAPPDSFAGWSARVRACAGNTGAPPKPGIQGGRGRQWQTPADCSI